MDGRELDTIRPITVEVGLLPRAHGSALFTRGETQALTVATLGPSSDVQRIDTISPEESKRYLHHYNMPPYSTGENKQMRGPGRREIGHGALAERALLPVLPSEEEFPYVIRLVSECVTSNGSTSMASTCGSTLALMDAGVPIKAPVAGAAMGLVSELTAASRCSPTSSARRMPSVTWTSRSPARATASPHCRWTSRSRASARRSSGRASRRPTPRGSSSSTRCWKSSPRRARRSAPSRRASPPSRSTPRRSATSSARAAP